MADLYLTNTLTRKKEKFVPIKEGKVGVYSCGPTVYWNQHIGHMYAYVQWDILVRFLRYLGYEVKWVMNITDVGHMTSDEDTGEDKMEKGAKREGLSVWDIANKYIKQFLDSMDALNIKRPDVLSRATEHIPEQIEIIKQIEKNGYIYRTQTGLVFDTSKFKNYPDFAKLDLKKQKAGARVEVDTDKKLPWDFLLWVTNQPNHIMLWDSPWGKGFPGWHIECTAMSVKYLGEQFDIHTGGKEHVAVHHTNEIAQGYGAYGKKLANFWLHNEWMTLKGEKISKSLGNMVTVENVEEKGYKPLALRYLILNSNYRKGMDFTWEALDSAQAAHDKLTYLMQSFRTSNRTVLSSEKELKVEKYREFFVNALCDDLNVAKALGVVWEVVKSNIPSEDKYDLLISFDEVLGLGLSSIQLETDVSYTLPESGIKLFAPPSLSDEIIQKMDSREKERAKGNYEKADEIRVEIEKIGYKLLDFQNGPKLTKI